MRLGRVTKRVWAFLMSIVMVLSMVVVNGSSSKVEAASKGYSVTINLYDDYDMNTQSNVTDHLRSRNNEGPFYLVAVAKGGRWVGFPPNVQWEEWTTYAVKKIDSLNSASTTISFEKGDFRIDQFRNNADESTFYGNDNNGGNGHFDPANSYNMDSVILYRVKDGIKDSDVRIDNISLNQMLAQFDYSDAAPAGYKFRDNTMSHPETKSNDSATISLYKAYDTSYELRLKADANNGVISAADKYAVVVKVDHWLNDNPTYFVYDNLEYDGASGLVKIPVSSSDWLDRNGSAIANEKFTGNEKSREVYLLRKKRDVGPNELLKLEESIASTILNGEAVGAYYFRGVTTGDEVDEAAQKEVVYDQLNLEAIPVDTNYNYLSVLGDAVNYGMVANTMTAPGHFESNYAINTLTGGGSGEGSQPCQPDLSGDGQGNRVPGNFLLGDVADGSKANFGSAGGDPSKYSSYLITTDDVHNNGKVVLDGGSENYITVVRTDKQTINSAVNGMISHMQTVSN
ncbi:MAG: hypothetical protein K5897_01545, partial [Eubacterium sp.]|nr:hypothetical protein [Eubacterium sp.]